MKPRTKTSPITRLVIFTSITCLFWVGLEIYRRLSQNPPSNVPANILSPLNPEINTQQLNTLKTRFQAPLILPSPTPPSPTPSPTKQLTPTPTPTPSPTT